MDVVRGMASLLGRVMLAAIFVAAAFANKILTFDDTVAAMTAEGVPLPSIALVGAIVFSLLGGASVATGLFTRLGATLLLVFLALATYTFHDFWTMADEAAAKMHQIHVMKNLAIGGGLLFLIANGGGAASLDNVLRARDPDLDEDD